MRVTVWIQNELIPYLMLAIIIIIESKRSSGNIKMKTIENIKLRKSIISVFFELRRVFINKTNMDPHANS